MDFAKKYLKWISTAFVLTGILLTNLNNYPMNIFIHGLGAIGWTFAGYINNDRALMVNFGIQIPLFALGYVKVFFKMSETLVYILYGLAIGFAIYLADKYIFKIFIQ